jgi:hypothetical protein
MRNNKRKQPDGPSLADAILFAEETGWVGFAHLLYSDVEGRIKLVCLGAGSPAAECEKALREVGAAPTVALIADDEYRKPGPTGWPSVDCVLAWATHVLIDAAPAGIDIYRMATAAAVTGRRVLLIKASGATVDAWYEFAVSMPHRPSVLSVLPHTGGVHPVPVPRDKAH